MKQAAARVLTAEQEIAVLKAKLAAFEEQGKLTIKRLAVSEKGAVSVYFNKGRFPVTLYPERMLLLLDAGPQIRDFIEDNKSRLNWKSQAAE